MTTKADILKSIRGKCLDCCCGSRVEVSICHLKDCDLWAFRLGRDPDPSRQGIVGNLPSGRSTQSKKQHSVCKEA